MKANPTAFWVKPSDRHSRRLDYATCAGEITRISSGSSSRILNYRMRFVNIVVFISLDPGKKRSGSKVRMQSGRNVGHRVARRGQKICAGEREVFHAKRQRKVRRKGCLRQAGAF